ncbi:MAG: hypothetical protein KBC98_02240 [Candidatus Pacebacteria bacterium]|nr:hypothetical protein [Candidatus Paceibacterota bacterium]
MSIKLLFSKIGTVIATILTCCVIGFFLLIPLMFGLSHVGKDSNFAWIFLGGYIIFWTIFLPLVLGISSSGEKEGPFDEKEEPFLDIKNEKVIGAIYSATCILVILDVIAYFLTAFGF